MPLVEGGSEKAVGENIAIERHAGKSEKVAVAIAESEKDQSRHDKLAAIMDGVAALAARLDAIEGIDK